MSEKKPAFILTNKSAVVSASVLDGYAMKEAGGSRQLPEDSFGKEYEGGGLVAPIYNLEALAKLTEINTWHGKAVRVKSTDVAGVGWGIKQRAGIEKGNEANKNILTEFFSSQTLSMTTSELLVRVMHDYESTGIAYIEVPRNYAKNKIPVSLSHLPSYTIRVHKDQNRYCQVRGLKKAWFKRFGFGSEVNFETGLVDNNVGEEKRATELIRFMNYAARSPYYGLPQIIPALGAIEGALSLRDYNLKFFDNYGVPSYAVYITGDYDLGALVVDGETTITEDGVTRDVVITDAGAEYEVVDAIKTHMQTIAKNPHSPLVIAIPTNTPEGEIKIEFKPLSVDVKEASFRLYRQDNRDEILTADGVPPYRVGLAELGSLGGNIAKESTNIYKQSELTPRKEMLVEAINRYIIREGFQIFDWEFYLEDIDIQDTKTDTEIAGFLFERGAITPNELIDYFGKQFGLKRQSILGMDWHYIQGKAVETGEVVRQEILSSVKDLHGGLLSLVAKSKGAA